MYEKVMSNESMKIFSELLSVPSPTGREELVAAKILEIAARWGYKGEQDYAGNVVIRVKGNGKSSHTVMFSAHMDEIGLVVTKIEPDGKLCIHKLGGMLPWKLGERPIEILTDNRDTILGVASFGAGHSQVGQTSVDWSNMRVITGLTVEQLKEKGVRVGSVAVLPRSHVGPIIFGTEEDPMIAAWTYDDRMGCANQLRVLKTLKDEGFTPNCDMIFAFSKQEEVKGNGIKPLVIRELPDVLMCIDGGTPFAGSGIVANGGPVCLTKDKLADYSFDVILAIKAAAKAVGTELQFAVTDVAYTDASLALQSGGPLRIGHVGFVRENSHGYEVMAYSMLDKFFNVLYSFVKTFVP
jgi:putative aminopeptidase FrvX